MPLLGRRGSGAGAGAGGGVVGVLDVVAQVAVESKVRKQLIIYQFQELKAPESA